MDVECRKDGKIFTLFLNLPSQSNAHSATFPNHIRQAQKVKHVDGEWRRNVCRWFFQTALISIHVSH